jgi:hypothetical protein
MGRTTGIIGRAIFVDEGTMLLEGIHDVTVDTVGPCRLRIVTVYVLREDVLKVSFSPCHKFFVGTADDVFLAHVNGAVARNMNWLHSCFPTCEVG